MAGKKLAISSFGVQSLGFPIRKVFRLNTTNESFSVFMCKDLQISLEFAR
jgi:hypothetical protein